MNKRKMLAIATMSTLLGGCCFAGPNGTGNDTTYGVANNKWSVMSLDQRESAKEVYQLEQVRMAEQNKLNTLRKQKSDAVARRKTQHKDDLNTIEQEDQEIRSQQSKVSSITEKEQLKQKQREQDLDNLKQ